MSTSTENNQKPKVKISSRGGRREGAGRKKGATTVKTREIANREMENGLTPLEFMLQVMREEPSPDLEPKEYFAATQMRFEAAKAAAPYMHPRLAAIEHTGEMTIKSLAQELSILNGAE